MDEVGARVPFDEEPVAGVVVKRKVYVHHHRQLIEQL